MNLENDLITARSRLLKNNLSFVIVKHGKIVFETKSKGIRMLLEAISTYQKEVEGASIADKVVGKAAMFLIIRARIKSVYAKVISTAALELASSNDVSVLYDRMVKCILNKARSDTCPFEKMVENVSSTEQAFQILRDVVYGKTVVS
ncbi:MAG: DUF1893 domain-containing protein [Nitrososphaeria archaeon]